MRRGLLIATSAISFGVLFAVTALWARSFWRVDLLEFTSAREWEICSARGGVVVHVITRYGGDAWQGLKLKPASDSPELSFFLSGSPDEFAYRSNRSAFEFTYSDEESSGIREQFLRFPHWALAGAAAVLPGCIPIGWLRRRRKRIQGRCANCGYDLRATPERCPECGTARVAGEVKVAQD